MSQTKYGLVDTAGRKAARSIHAAAVLLVGCAAVLSLSTMPAMAQEAGKSSQKTSAPTEELKQILVFPTDTKGGISDQISDDIATVIKTRLTGSKHYDPVAFLRSIPTVKLALSEQVLTGSDVKKPFDSDVKLKKIAGVTGFSYVIVSSIDDYEYDSSKNQVNLVISARLIDYTGAKAVVRSAAQSASSPASGGNTAELKLATDTARALVDKLMTAILTPKPTTPTK